MSEDIVARLRQSSQSGWADGCQGCRDTERDEAADEIERLRAALKPFAEAAWDDLPDENDAVPIRQKRGTYTITAGDARKARAAYQQLKEKK